MPDALLVLVGVYSNVTTRSVISKKLLTESWWIDPIAWCRVGIWFGFSVLLGYLSFWRDAGAVGVCSFL